VVCGIWLKGKHSDFTGSSPHSIGRRISSVVNVPISQSQRPR
jgi:hypothetical protein